jgi:hypothetical protein
VAAARRLMAGSHFACPDLLGATDHVAGYLTQTGGSYPVYLVTQSDLLLAARLMEEEGNWEALIEYALDPVKFAKEVLGVRLWRKQREILRALCLNPRVTVAACYGSGKTFLAAIAVIWWMCTRDVCMVITTAPTQRQVRDCLWREIAKLHKGALRRLPGKVLCDKWIICTQRMAKGYTGKGENTVSGLHAPRNVLFIEDEAAGIEQRTEQGFAGITIGPGARRLKIGNPICDSGPFYDSHMHPTIREEWVRFNIDALETPNVRGVFRKRKDNPDAEPELIIRQTKDLFPGLVDPEWVRQHKIKWYDQGIKGHWENRCRGRFYVTSADKVVPVEWALMAEGRWEFASALGDRVLGCDIAAGGADSTKLALRTGQRVRIVDAWQGVDDHDEQAKRIADHAVANNVQFIVIDKTGPGKAVFIAVQKLQESGYLPLSITIIGVGLGSSANDRETYNLRSDEVQFELRWAFNPKNPECVAYNGCDPGNAGLRMELTLRSWWKNPAFKIQADGKKQLKEKGNHESPDGADAVSMACIKLPQRMCLL